jgi:hypothetical protein
VNRIRKYRQERRQIKGLGFRRRPSVKLYKEFGLHVFSKTRCNGGISLRCNKDDQKIAERTELVSWGLHVKTIFENYSVSLTRFDRNGFLSRPIYAMQWDVVRTVFFVALFGSFAFAQDRTALTLNQISDLLKSGVSSTRIVQLLEQNGVGFELNEAALRRLRANGADARVLSTVKRMAARYTEEQRRNRVDAEEEKRRRADAETKKQEETSQTEKVKQKTQEQAKQGEVEKRMAEELSRQKSVQGKSRAQEEARQRPQKGSAATLITQADVGRVASLRNVMSTEGGEGSGELVNNTKQTLRDVQLQILYSWRWNNEYQPGKDDPGTARYHVLSQEVPPSQTARFNYKPSPPLASREDGQFDISVKIVGFAQVFQPDAQR